VKDFRDFNPGTSSASAATQTRGGHLLGSLNEIASTAASIAKRAETFADRFLGSQPEKASAGNSSMTLSGEPGFLGEAQRLNYEIAAQIDRIETVLSRLERDL